MQGVTMLIHGLNILTRNNILCSLIFYEIRNFYFMYFLEMIYVFEE